MQMAPIKQTMITVPKERNAITATRPFPPGWRYAVCTDSSWYLLISDCRAYSCISPHRYHDQIGERIRLTGNKRRSGSKTIAETRAGYLPHGKGAKNNQDTGIDDLYHNTI